MSVIKVKATQFTGTSHVFNRSNGGLASILRAMLIDNANLRVQVAGVHDFTDSSTGTSGAGVFPVLPVPVTTVNAATATTGATASALNTSLGKTQNAIKVIASTLTEARSILGLPTLTVAAGTIAAADTIPAQDKTNAGAAGTSTATFLSTKAALQNATDDLYSLAEAANDVFLAIGVTPLVLPKVPRAALTTMETVGTVTASASGSDAALASEVQAWLVAAANGMATIAAAWTTAMTQSDAQSLRVIAG